MRSVGQIMQETYLSLRKHFMYAFRFIIMLLFKIYLFILMFLYVMFAVFQKFYLTTDAQRCTHKYNYSCLTCHF